jgi:hypothetical protein
VGVGDFVPLSRQTLTRGEDGPVCLGQTLAQVQVVWSGDFVRFSRRVFVLEVRVWAWLVSWLV